MQLIFVRFIQFIVGLWIKTLGLALIIRSNLGTGAWEAFYVGLAKKTGFSVGLWIFIIGFFLIWMNAALWHRKPTYTSFFTITIVGMFINWWLGVLEMNPVEIHIQFAIFWTGFIIASIGASVYLLSSFTPTPVDQLMFALSYKLRIPIMFTKTIGEIVALVFALQLHGSVGIGTIIFTLLFGPLIQFLMNKWQFLTRYRNYFPH